jgi:integrase
MSAAARHRGLLVHEGDDDRDNGCDDRSCRLDQSDAELPAFTSRRVRFTNVDRSFAAVEDSSSCSFVAAQARDLRSQQTDLVSCGWRHVGDRRRDLKVSDVDFLRRTVRVERQRGSDTGKIGPPKTPKSARTVPLGQVVIDELAHHLAVYPSRDWLFTTADGEPLIYRAWQYGWDAARARVGLTTDTHDLRHFFASALISGGASVKQVQTILGHPSPMTTLQTFAHLWPGDDDRTRGVIDNILGPIARGAATA